MAPNPHTTVITRPSTVPGNVDVSGKRAQFKERRLREEMDNIPAESSIAVPQLEALWPQ